MPSTPRPNTKSLYLALDPQIYDLLKRHCEDVAERDMKTEVSFAILEHIKHGRRPLPPELKKPKHDESAQPKRRKRKDHP